MKSMKRAFSLFVALVMALSVMSLSAFAAKVTYFAEIGDAQYTSLSEAISEASDKATVKLLKNVSGDVSVGGKTLTIDLNGKTIDSALKVNSNANVTITNSDTKTDKVSGVSGADAGRIKEIDVEANSTLNVEKGTVANGITSSGTLNITGGYVLNASTPAESVAVVVKGGTLSVSDNAYIRGGTGIKVEAGKLEVSGGYVEGNINDTEIGGNIHVASGAEAVVSGGTVGKGRGGQIVCEDGATLSITNGTISCDLFNCKGVVTGGLFTSKYFLEPV